MRRLVTLALVALALACVRGARAQGYDPATAESVFQAGKTAERHGDYKTACERFAESERLDPAPGTLLNLGECEEHLGAVASAWGHLVEAKDRLPQGDDRLPFARERIAALTPRVPHLVVRLPAAAPEGTQVLRGGVAVGPAALGVPLAVDPGPLTLTVVAPGRTPTALTVTLREGETREVLLEVPRAIPATATAPEPAAAPASDPRRTVGRIVGGVGVAGLALGAVTGILAVGDASTFRRECTPAGACRSQAGVDAASAGKTASTLSTACFIGGAVLTGVGLYFVLSGGRAQPASVGATALPGGGALSLVIPM